jgi:Winged helix DNA-binding domain
MPRRVPDDLVRRLRLRAQRLTGARPEHAHEVVRALGGLQAQSTPASRLAVRPRGAGLDAQAVVRACNRERSVVRTWAMRGTLHMVPAEDAAWMGALLRPPPGAGRRRRLELGLDDGLLERALPAIGELLAVEAPRTRAELVAGLAGRGVRVDPEGQAPAHLVAWAARAGLLCRGPDRDDDEPTYVLLADWAGEQPELGADEALAELARRYLGAHGPAGVDDFAYWAGIPAGRASRGVALVAGELEPVEVAGRPAWLPAAAAAGGDPDADPCVRLLPHFDAYLLGWRSRELVLPARFARRVQAGGGWIHPAVLVDGRVVGTWRQRRARDRLVVEVEPFEPLDPAIRPGLEAEAADLGRFLRTRATLAVAGAGRLPLEVR